MKSFIEYINEKKEDTVYRFRFDLRGLKLIDNFYPTLEKFYHLYNIYSEKTDDGFKLRVYQGQEDKLEVFIDLLNAVYEKNKDNEDEDVIATNEKLLLQIAKLYDLANGDDEDEDEKSDEDKKDETKDIKKDDRDGKAVKKENARKDDDTKDKKNKGDDE